MKSVPKAYALFLPESVVDVVPTEKLLDIAAELKLTHTELMKQQKEGLKQAQKTKAKAEPDRQSESAVRNTGSASGVGRGNSVDSYGSHGAGPEGRNQNPQHQVNHEYDVIHTPPAQRHLSQPEPRKEMAHGGDTNTSSRLSNVDQHRGLRHSDVDQHKELEHDQRYQHDQLHQLYPQDTRIDQGASAHKIPKESVLATTGVNDSLIDSNLAVGSLIQIQPPEPNNPLRYGTIKWIGVVQTIKGKVAGIELVIVLFLFRAILLTNFVMCTLTNLYFYCWRHLAKLWLPTTKIIAFANKSGNIFDPAAVDFRVVI